MRGTHLMCQPRLGEDPRLVAAEVGLVVGVDIRHHARVHQPHSTLCTTANTSLAASARALGIRNVGVRRVYIERVVKLRVVLRRIGVRTALTLTPTLRRLAAPPRQTAPRRPGRRLRVQPFAILRRAAGSRQRRRRRCGGRGGRGARRWAAAADWARPHAQPARHALADPRSAGRKAARARQPLAAAPVARRASVLAIVGRVAVGSDAAADELISNARPDELVAQQLHLAFRLCSARGRGGAGRVRARWEESVSPRAVRDATTRAGGPLRAALVSRRCHGGA